MIPKIIHYCWLSNDPIPSNLQRCMDSWKKYCPEYEIIKWDTTRFDINSVQLVKDAFENKKYAYAADYIRAYALYTMGGVYLDSDVMLYQNIDHLLDGRFVSGMEYHTKSSDIQNNASILDEEGHRVSDDMKVYGIGIQAAFLASEPAHPLFKRCMDFYKHITLEKLLESHYTAPTVLAFHCEDYGIVYCDIEQRLSEGVHLYPTKIISHFDQFNKQSVAVHYCAGSWVDKTLKQKAMLFIKTHKSLFLLYNYIRRLFK